MAACLCDGSEPRMIGLEGIKMSGHARRLRRLFHPTSRRTIIVPVDDGLIFGPLNGLLSLGTVLSEVVAGGPNALLAFSGVFQHHQQTLQNLGWIINITVSTSRSFHTRKQLMNSVEGALKLGADCVAVHVNITSKFESEMLRTLGQVAEACRTYQLPLLAIMYPRKEKEDGDDNFDELKKSDVESYGRLVAHCARIGMELGADIVKTQYTGEPETFSRVVEAACPVPVVVAGGPLKPAARTLQIAEEAIAAGAAGISFGRNVFSRHERTAIVKSLTDIVHYGAKSSEVIERYHPTDRAAVW